MLMKTKKKGFTLAELLIVVAIIAILVAIAIPVFTSTLNSAKKGVDDANIRAAYGQFVITKMSEATYDGTIALPSKADVVAAFVAIGVTELQYYATIDVPASGRWVGAGSGGLDPIVAAGVTGSAT